MYIEGNMCNKKEFFTYTHRHKCVQWKKKINFFPPTLFILATVIRVRVLFEIHTYTESIDKGRGPSEFFHRDFNLNKILILAKMFQLKAGFYIKKGPN